MAHPTARRGCHSCDVTDNGLGDVLFDVIGRLFLFGTADLADQHYRLGVRICFESCETVDKGRTRDRVAANANARRNTDPHLFQLVESLIGEGTAAAHDAHWPPGECDLACSYTDIALPWTDHARAVGADKADSGVIVLELAVDASFVLGRDPLGYANDYLHTGSRCLQHRRRRDLGWHSDKAGIGTCRRPRFSCARKHRDTFDLLATLCRVDTSDYLGAIVAVTKTVETRLAAGQAVDDQPGAFIDEYAHFSLPANATTLRAASIMFGDVITMSDSTVRKISRP